MTVIGQAEVKIIPNTTGFASELGKLNGPLGMLARQGESATKSMSGGFGGVGLAIAAVGVAAVAFAVKSAEKFKEVGGEVLKLERYTGEGAVAMSKLRFAAQQSGIDTDKLALSMKFLSKNIAAGKGDLDKFGIASLDAHGKTLPLDTILLNVAAKFKDMPNGVDKTALAIKLFGKAGADMIPMLNRGRDGLQALEQQAAKYGQVLTEKNIVAVKAATMAHREQTAAMQGLQIQIGSQVLPVMTQLTKSITTGILVAMPLITEVITHSVVPAFNVLAAIVGTAANFLSSHAGAVKVVAGVIGGVLVPALTAWAVAQLKVVAVNLATGLLGVASMAVRAAGSIGILTGSLEGGTVAFTAMNAVMLAGYAGVGLIIMKLIGDYNKMQSSARGAADEIVKSATSPQAAIEELTRKQAEYHKEMGGGVTVLGLHMFASDADAKAAARAAAGYKATTGELDKLKKATQDQADAAATAGSAIDDELTKQGLKMASLGNATHLTTDQVEGLAASLKIDLTKNTAGATEKLVDAAVKLGYTTNGAIKLRDANKVLGDEFKNVSEKATAFKSALDALIGGQLSADAANIKYQQDLADLAGKLVAGSRTFDENTQAGRDNKTAIDNAATSAINNADAVYKQTGSMDKAKGVIADFVAHLTATLHAAGFTTTQINALTSGLNLVPAALNQIDPALTTLGSNLAVIGGKLQFTASAVNALINSANNARAASAAAGGGNLYGPGPGVPGHAFGGMVPGPTGVPHLAIVHGGEEVRTPDQQRRADNANQSERNNVTYAPNVTVYAPQSLDPQQVGAFAARESLWAMSTRLR